MEKEENQTPEVEQTEGTEAEETAQETPTEESIETPQEDIDYKKKFSESTREAQRLLEQQKEKDRLLAEREKEIEELRKKAESSLDGNYADNSESLYPGFENLSEEEQRNLMAYTDSIKKRVQDDIYKDPSIAFAKESYNEKRWNEAFETVAEKFPELRESKDEFKKKYFKSDNVPTNIGEILEDLSKVYLFDKAKDIGAQEAMEKSSHIDIERTGGGDKTPKPAVSRSLEDWQRMAESNPREFARHSEDFKKDMESGKLK